MKHQKAKTPATSTAAALPPAMPPICAVDNLVGAAAAPVSLVCGAAVAVEGADEDADEDELVLVMNVELELGTEIVDNVGSIVTEGVM
jgi:hypothetical protein